MARRPATRLESARGAAGGLLARAGHPGPPDAGSPRRLEIVGEDGRQNVVVHDADGRVHELTGFTQPQHVYDAAISPDGTLASVWHMAFSPRQISVYDVRTRELLHRFAPGSGGDLRWAKHEPVLVLTVSGMGMGGARATVFAIDGTTIVRTGVGDYAFSPDGRWLMAIAFEQGRGRVEVLRVSTGERLFEAWLPASLTPTMLGAGWDEVAGPMVRITTDWERGSVEAIDLARLVPILERVEGG
jgi:dipeptidyl aminopeptidase/acylaminoacyl peptidase